MMEVFGIPLVPEAPAVVTVIGSRFTATEIILIISAVSTAATTILAQWRNGAKSDKIAAAVIGTPTQVGVVGKVEKVVERVEEIHTLTNSTMTEIRGELAQSKALVLSQAAVIQELTSERDKKEMRDAFAAVPQAPALPQQPAPGPVKTLSEGIVDKAVLELTKDKK